MPRQPGANVWAPPKPAPKPLWDTGTAPERPAPPGGRVLLGVLLSGLVAATVLSDGVGVNLLLVALAAAVAAGSAAVARGRRARPWTVVWGVSAFALLLVPVLSDAGWPSFLAFVAAVGAASLALHGGTRWAAVLLGPIWLLPHFFTALPWAARGLKGRSLPSSARSRAVPLVKSVVVTGLLLLVFGALFASADAAVGELVDELVPSFDLGELPFRVFLFGVGVAVALAAAHLAAAPRRFDRLPVGPGRERGRTEWALPMVALNLLFGAFVAIQAVVFFGGYEAVMSKPGLVPAEYARQGFWQLLWVTVLALAVVALAQRWAPRQTASDRLLAKGLVGLLCVLTLVVVASAYYRMQRYVDVFGLTRLRVTVTAAELWLGVVFLLVLAAVLAGASVARLLPRAVALSAVAGVAVFGLVRPDALIAEQNVARFERLGTIDLDYLSSLSADAVPALDRLPADRRTCALQYLAESLDGRDTPWYAASLSESRAQQLLRERPVDLKARCSTSRYPMGEELP
ncbi:DUF4153 domain-containing protein [Kitasatospora sp. NPDC051853]|uniref:DUF4153 domain-containing protein n=1 Tax=Kitasatospora sp. NPDC051853 TaxID=3364058 RepID=UPI00379D2C07